MTEAARTFPLRLLVWLGWTLPYALLLWPGDASLVSGPFWEWGTPAPSRLEAFGAAAPRLVEQGEWQRLLLSPWLHRSLLGYALLSLWLASSLGRARALVGSARAFLVFAGTGVAGAGAHVVFHAGSSIVGAGPFDALMGLLGAQLVVGTVRGGEGGRVARNSALVSLAWIAAFTALFWWLAGDAPAALLRALFGIEAMLGGLLAGVLLGLLLAPRREHAGRGFRLAARLALLLLLAAAAVQVPRALAEGERGRFVEWVDALRAVELRAEYLAGRPQAGPDERASVGAALDDLAAHPFLEGFVGAAAARAYLDAMRPVATGDMSRPDLVVPRLRQTFLAWWRGHEEPTRAKYGLDPRGRLPWGAR